MLKSRLSAHMACWASYHRARQSKLYGRFSLFLLFQLLAWLGLHSAEGFNYPCADEAATGCTRCKRCSNRGCGALEAVVDGSCLSGSQTRCAWRAGWRLADLGLAKHCQAHGSWGRRHHPGWTARPQWHLACQRACVTATRWVGLPCWRIQVSPHIRT